MIRRFLVRTAALTLAACGLSGCLTLAAVHIAREEAYVREHGDFEPADHAWAMGPGSPVTGRLAVTADHVPADGDRARRVPRETLTCEGRLVRLIPDTLHMRLLLENRRLPISSRGFWQAGGHGWDWPAESSSPLREAVCGEGGAFHFPSTPDGRYLVLAQIQPQAERRSLDDEDLFLIPVTVRAGQPLNLDIDATDFVRGYILPR